jgi:hypothetical protein
MSSSIKTSAGAGSIRPPGGAGGQTAWAGAPVGRPEAVNQNHVSHDHRILLSPWWSRPRPGRPGRPGRTSCAENLVAREGATFRRVQLFACRRLSESRLARRGARRQHGVPGQFARLLRALLMTICDVRCASFAQLWWRKCVDLNTRRPASSWATRPMVLPAGQVGRIRYRSLMASVRVYNSRNANGLVLSFALDEPRRSRERGERADSCWWCAPRAGSTCRRGRTRARWTTRRRASSASFGS